MHTEKFYIKVVYGDKIKKYLISDPKQIKFTQIKEAFGLSSSWEEQHYYYQIVSNSSFNPCMSLEYLTQQELIEHLTKTTAKDRQSVKIKIIQKLLLAESDRARKDSQDSLDIPNQIQKKRSKSVDLEDVFQAGCVTEVFVVQDQNQLEDNFQRLEVPIKEQKNIQLEPNQKHFLKGSSSSQKIQYFTQSFNLDNQQNSFLSKSVMIKTKKQSQLQIIEERLRKRIRELEKQRKTEQTEKIFNVLNL